MGELRDAQGLFRQEALSYLDRSADGRVVLIRPISHALLTAGILAFMMALVGFLAMATYRRSDPAKGRLVFTDKSTRIHVDQPGVLMALYVRDGQHVEAGDRLFALDRSSFDLDGNRLSELTQRQLAASAALLEEQKALLVRQHNADTRLYNAKQARNREAQRVNRELIELTRHKQALTAEGVQSAQALLADGQVSRATVRQKELEHLDLQISLQRMEEDRLNLVAEAEGFRADLARKDVELEQAAHELDLKLADLEERRQRSEAEDARTIKAPISGVVANMTAKVGTRVSPQQAVMLIVPEGSPLEAEVYVAPKAIGFVHPSQPVHVQYDAFPYQKYGYFAGTIHEASESTFTADDIEGAKGIDGPFYRVTVALADQGVTADGVTHPIRPGMTLSANILGEERSLFAWLFEPAISIQKKIQR